MVRIVARVDIDCGPKRAQASRLQGQVTHVGKGQAGLGSFAATAHHCGRWLYSNRMRCNCHHLSRQQIPGVPRPPMEEHHSTTLLLAVNLVLIEEGLVETATSICPLHPPCLGRFNLSFSRFLSDRYK